MEILRSSLHSLHIFPLLSSFDRSLNMACEDISRNRWAPTAYSRQHLVPQLNRTILSCSYCTKECIQNCHCRVLRVIPFLLQHHKLLEVTNSSWLSNVISFQHDVEHCKISNVTVYRFQFLFLSKP